MQQEKKQGREKQPVGSWGTLSNSLLEEKVPDRSVGRNLESEDRQTVKGFTNPMKEQEVPYTMEGMMGKTEGKQTNKKVTSVLEEF
jgi:hypothetical protein